MGAPSTLPADFFQKQGPAPATLPADFFQAQGPPPPLAAPGVEQQVRTVPQALNTESGQQIVGPAAPPQAPTPWTNQGLPRPGETVHVGYPGAYAPLMSEPAPEGSFFEQLLAGFQRAPGQFLESVGGTVTALGESPLLKVNPAVALPMAATGGVTADIGRAISAKGKELGQGIIPGVGLEQVASGEASLGEAAGSAIGQNLPQMAASVMGGVAAGRWGASAVSYLQNAGEVYMNSLEKGEERPTAALLAGIPMAFLDAFTPGKIAGRLGWQVTSKVDEIPGFKGWAIRTLTDTLGESGTEAMQDTIAAMAEPGAFWSHETLMRAANAAFGGALVGGMVSGATDPGAIAPRGTTPPEMAPISTLPPLPEPPAPAAVEVQTAAAAPPMAPPAVTTQQPAPGAHPTAAVAAPPIYETWKPPMVTQSNGQVVLGMPGLRQATAADFTPAVEPGRFTSTSDLTLEIHPSKTEPGFHEVHAPISVPGKGGMVVKLASYPDAETAFMVGRYVAELSPTGRRPLRGLSPKVLADRAFEFGTVPEQFQFDTPEGPVTFRDESKQLTYKDAYNLQNNGRYATLLGRVVKYTQLISDAAKADKQLTYAEAIRVGVPTNQGKPVYGHFWPATRKVTINPLAASKGLTPVQAAQEAMLTMLHELAHGDVQGHGPDFSRRLERLQTWTSNIGGRDVLGEMRNDFTNVLSDSGQPGVLHPAIVSAAAIVDRSGGRPRGGRGAAARIGEEGQSAGQSGQGPGGGPIFRDLEEASGLPGPVWYSALRRAVERIGGARITADSLFKTARKWGVKEEEIKWSGLRLELPATISKADLFDLLTQGGLNIAETSSPDGILLSLSGVPMASLQTNSSAAVFSVDDVAGHSPYHKLLIRRAIQEAILQNSQTFSWPKGSKELDSYTKKFVAQWGTKADGNSFAIPESMRRSVLNDGQPLFREVPDEAHEATARLNTVWDGINKGLPPGELGVSPEAKDEIIKGIDHFGARQKHLTTVKQLGWEYPEFTPVQSFIASIEQMMSTASAVKWEAEEVLSNWRKLGPARMDRVGKALFEATILADEKGRKPTQDELNSIFRQQAFDPAMADQFIAVRQFLDDRLDQLEGMMIAELANEVDPNSLEYMQELGKIKADFDRLRDGAYFPFTRYGKHAVIVQANGPVEYDGKKYRKGSLIAMETYESEGEQQRRYGQLKAHFAAHSAQVAMDVLPDSLQQLYGMPPQLVERMVKHLKLSPDQVDLAQQFAYSLAPNRAFLKHMMHRRGVAGFSLDAPRVFATYAQSVGNFIGRLENRRPMLNAIQEANAAATAMRATGSAVATRKMANEMQYTYNYVMNPPGEFHAARGLLFAWNFFGVPVQAFLNFMQVPMFSYGYLAAAPALHGKGLVVGKSDVESAVAHAKAMKDVTSEFFRKVVSNGKYIGHLDQRDQDLLYNAMIDGTVDQGFTSELAALAHGSMLRTALPGVIFNKIPTDTARVVDYYARMVLDLGLKPFKLSESGIRRVTLLAAGRMARARGMNFQDEYKFAKDAVDRVHFDYSQWNRMTLGRGVGRKAGQPEENSIERILRPAAPLLTVYKTYLQGALYNYGFLGPRSGMPGKGRALLALLALGGVQALPFAENLFDMIDLLATWFKQAFGLKEPRVDIRKDLREIFNAHGVGDWAMHGLSRRVLGIWDMQNRLSLGDILPTDPVSRGLLGEIKPEAAVMRTVQELSGAAGAQGINFTKAVFDFQSGDAKLWRSSIPNLVRSILSVRDSTKAGKYVTASGEPLVPLDLEDPWHQAEVIGQLIGFRPTRVAAQQESWYGAAEVAAYYRNRKELVLNAFGKALSSRDAEEIAEAKAALRSYQETAPTDFKFKDGDAIVSSMKARVTNRRLRELGLPSQREYLQLYREYQEVFR